MEKTDILTSKTGARSDIIVVHVLGYLDTVAAYNFREQLDELIKSGNHKYIIDLEKLDYISSAGIGVFPAIAPDLQKKKGGIVFVNVSEKTLKLFKMIGLTTIFKVKDTLENAVKEFDADG